MILVVGSTGILGGEVCRLLREAGKPVRGLVRSTSGEEKVARLKAMGVETVLGDLKDPASLQAACQGVVAVITTATTTISMQPGDSIPVTDQQGQLDLVQAAREAGVKHFTMVSIPMTVGDCPLRTAKRTVEQAIISGGMEYTILRPCIFMEMWLSPGLGFDYINGKATIYGDGHSKNGYISVGNVAQYAVDSLNNPAARNACFDLGQPRNYSMLEAVYAFEQVSAKSFELSFVPTSALEAQMSTATDPLQVSFATLMHDMAVGNLRGDPREAERCFGLKLTTLEEYARRVSG
ncbi:MAG: SDR family oxidoreductase [Anaerolineae bacterium]|nr:SDR family oxidoreductase [Anaerolineae bacterium]